MAVSRSGGPRSPWLRTDPERHTQQLGVFYIKPDLLWLLAPEHPVLVRLLAQAHAVQRMLVDGSDEPSISHYSKWHLWKLLRISWLAPDIVSDIIEGRQPAGLTGRRLLRCSDLPLEWSEQRAFLGFS